MSREKELNFFIQEYNWHKGIEWYKSNFTGKARIHGESSPGYTFYPFLGGVPERMYSLVPNAKLIYILRDPIDRIISNYIHNYADEKENRKISDALMDFNHNPYICRSKYYLQLEQYLNYFQKSNILIMTLEDLYNHRWQTLQKVFRFLNVDESSYSCKASIFKHKSSWKRRKNNFGLALTKTTVASIVQRLPFNLRGKVKTLLYYTFSHKIERPKLDDGLRQRLIDYLKDDIKRLREYTGRDFEGWCV